MTWSFTASLNVGRSSHTATLLPNGKVLAVGGGEGDKTAELYDPGTNPNQIDDAQFFVHQHYLDFLNREPDPGGLAYWTDRITQCGTHSSAKACLLASRFELPMTLPRSDENSA